MFVLMQMVMETADPKADQDGVQGDYRRDQGRDSDSSQRGVKVSLVAT